MVSPCSMVASELWIVYEYKTSYSPIPHPSSIRNRVSTSSSILQLQHIIRHVKPIRIRETHA